MFGWMKAPAFKRLIDEARRFRLKEKDPSFCPPAGKRAAAGGQSSGSGANLPGVQSRSAGGRKRKAASGGLEAAATEAVGELMAHRLAAVKGGGKKARVVAPSALDLQQLQQQEEEEEEEGEEGEEEEYEVNVLEIDGSGVGGGEGGEGGD
jgi:hypothetical protein